MLQDPVADLRRVPPLKRSARDMGRMLATAAASPPLVPRLACRKGSYTRTRVYADERFEVLLLDWSREAASEIHDHGGQHCWFVVLQGRLRVDDFGRVDAGDAPGKAVIEACGSRELRTGDVDLRSGRFDIHRVVAGGGRALTLHIYSRPLDAYLVYDRRAQRCEPALGTCDRVLSLGFENLSTR